MPYRRLAALAVIVAWLAPLGIVGSGPILCPVRRFTGLPCPTCGLTRSWTAALHGRPGASLAYHPLGAVTLGAAAAYALHLDERAPGLVRPLRRPGVGAALVAGWVLTWVVRLRAAGRMRVSGARPA